MTRLRTLGHQVDLQILDNEASAEYKRLITEEWGAKFQLPPPTSTDAMPLSAPSTPSKRTSSLFLSALPMLILEIIGIYLSLRRNSHLTFCVSPCSIQLNLHGNVSTALSTTMPPQSDPLDTVSSSTRRRATTTHGTIAARQLGTSALHTITTAANTLSPRKPRAPVSLIPWSSGIIILLCQP